MGFAPASVWVQCPGNPYILRNLDQAHSMARTGTEIWATFFDVGNVQLYINPDQWVTEMRWQQLADMLGCYNLDANPPQNAMPAPWLMLTSNTPNQQRMFNLKHYRKVERVETSPQGVYDVVGLPDPLPILSGIDDARSMQVLTAFQSCSGASPMLLT